MIPGKSQQQSIDLKLTRNRTSFLWKYHLAFRWWQETTSCTTEFLNSYQLMCTCEFFTNIPQPQFCIMMWRQWRLSSERSTQLYSKWSLWRTGMLSLKLNLSGGGGSDMTSIILLPSFSIFLLRVSSIYSNYYCLKWHQSMFVACLAKFVLISYNIFIYLLNLDHFWLI